MLPFQRTQSPPLYRRFGCESGASRPQCGSNDATTILRPPLSTAPPSSRQIGATKEGGQGAMTGATLRSYRVQSLWVGCGSKGPSRWLT
jgi:hypothetical protein